MSGTAATALTDMHFHLDFCRDPVAYAASVRAAGIGVLAVSCEPAGYEQALPLVSPGLVPALGLHPWWVARGDAGEAEQSAFERLAPDAPAFGELGLDFDDRHTPPGSHAAQLAALERCCHAANASARAAGVRKPLSIHAFRATDAVLDVLERTGCLETCACILHWFADSQPELSRAIGAGCWFSVNERAARSKRWREYAKLVPADKLLLETDLPEGPGSQLTAREHLAALGKAVRLLASSTGREPEDIAAQTARNARALLGGIAPSA